MLALACMLLAGAIVLVVLAVAVLDCVGHLPLTTRLALYALAGGLLWAGPERFKAAPGPGLSDLLFLTGVAGLLVCVYGRQLVRKIDRLDGSLDRRVRWGRRHHG